MSKPTSRPIEATPSEPPRKRQMTKKADVVQLPGFGLDLYQQSHLPIAQSWFASPMTVRERTMIGLMLALKDKPEWDRKVFDEGIVANWKDEAMRFSPDHGPQGTGRGRNPWNSDDQNGENLDIDGSAQQKQIDESVFDHVCQLSLMYIMAGADIILSASPSCVTTQLSSASVALLRPLTSALVSICQTQPFQRRPKLFSKSPLLPLRTSKMP